MTKLNVFIALNKYDWLMECCVGLYITYLVDFLMPLPVCSLNALVFIDNIFVDYRLLLSHVISLLLLYPLW